MVIPRDVVLLIVRFAFARLNSLYDRKFIAEGAVDNGQLRDVNEAIRSHAIEQVGKKLRGYMTDMKRIAVAG